MQNRIFRLLLILLTSCLFQRAGAQCIVDELAKDINNPKATQEFKDFIMGNQEGLMAYKKLINSPQVRKDFDVLNAASKFITNHGKDYMTNFPGKFDNILKNLVSYEVNVRCKTCTSGKNMGIPFLDEIIDDMDWALTNLKDKNVNVTSLFTEMATQGGYNVYKADGGAFMLNTLRQQAEMDSKFLSSIEQFEYQFLEGGNFEADLYRKIDGEMHLSEFKSLGETRWYGFSTDNQSVKQFMAYFTKKQKFEYFANASKLGGAEKAKTLVRNQFVKLFKAKANDLFDINPAFFQNILYDGKKIKISNADELVKYCEEADFGSSSLFDFVNVFEIQ